MNVGLCCLVDWAKNQQIWVVPLQAERGKGRKGFRWYYVSVIYVDLCHTACIYSFGCHLFPSSKALIHCMCSHITRPDHLLIALSLERHKSHLERSS